MKLKIKFLKLSAGIPVVIFNSKTAAKLGVHTNDRVLIKTLSNPPREISTTLNIAEGLSTPGELGVSSELKRDLGLKSGQKVDVNIDSAPESLVFIKKKLNGGKLSEKEIDSIIKDVVDNSLSEAEIALFISASYNQGMSMKEVIFLTQSIVKFGKHLNLHFKNVVDKHSIGGIPGNRTTPIVVSICAAAGLIMPKSSSRAITTSAGTADVIETIARVEFSVKEVEAIVRKTNACLVSGSSLEIVPADAKMIRIEKILKIDPESQLLASILAKKLAVGSKYILIDIPYGKTAKVDKKKALHLKKKFEYLGTYFKKVLKVVLTDASEPIGRGVGPSLELIDVINILDPEKKGPRDLEKKSLFLAGELLELTGKAKKGEGISMAERIVESGKAFAKFKEIIHAQSGNLNRIKIAKHKKNILAKGRGKIIEIDNKKINSLARVAGCPEDKSAGLYFYAKTHDSLKKGDKILAIYSESPSRLSQAVKFYQKEKPIIIK